MNSIVMKPVGDSLKSRKVLVSYMTKVYDHTPCLAAITKSELSNGKAISQYLYFVKDRSNNFLALAQAFENE